MSALPGSRIDGFEITQADDFSYRDPVDGSFSHRQGLRIELEGGARIVLRISGTDTEGATLRLYLERYEPDAADHDRDPQSVLAPLARVADEIARITERTGRARPSLVT